jgi:hypothetical protein
MTAEDDRDSTSAADGMVHLQAAAREMIGAARALLDAAEQLVEDPATAGKVVSMVSTFAQAAATAAPNASTSTDRDDDDDDGPVERIVVS